MKSAFAGRLLVLALGLGVPQMQGTIIAVYTDRTAWEAAVGSFTTETFNALSAGTLPPSPATVGLLTVEFPEYWAGNPQILSPGPVNGTPALQMVVGIDGNMTFGDLPEYSRLVLPNLATALGINFESVSSAGRVWMQIGSEIPIDVEVYLPDPGDGFLGIIANVPFQTITFTGKSTLVANPGELFAVDNVSFNEVPEPGHYGILGAAMLLLVRRARRKNTKLS